MIAPSLSSATGLAVVRVGIATVTSREAIPEAVLVNRACARAHASRQELIDALPLIGAGATGDPHWQAKVWQRLRDERPRARRRWLWQLTGAFAAACVLALWLGTCTAFDIPLRQSMYVLFVDDRADLPNAIALNSLLVNLARVVGPAIAGALLSFTSEAVCFALNALSFLAVIGAFLLMRWPVHQPPGKVSGFWASWVEGVRYAASLPPVRALLIMVAILAWTIAPYSALMPVYAKDIYGSGPRALGWLLAAAGAGALVSTFYLASRHSVRGLAGIIVRASAARGLPRDHRRDVAGDARARGESSWAR